MIWVFEIRAKLTELYQKFDFWINLVLKFVLLLVAFSRIRTALNYSKGTLSSSAIVLLLAAVSAFLPASLTVLLVVVYVTLQILSVSYIMAALVFLLFMVAYCFFLRFTPKYDAAMIATPVLQGFGAPYIMPLLMGLFGNLLTIVPVCCGVFAFYTISFIRKNFQTWSALQLDADPQKLLGTVISSLLKNPPMYVLMLIFAVVIVVVYFISRLNMDYSFEISVAVGTATMILGYIIGDIKYDMGISIPAMIMMSLVSAAVTIVFLFFYRVLQYSAAEHVEFEDDDFYYYVKAVPKVKAGAPKKKEKKVIKRRRDEEDDDDEEYEEAAMGLIDYSNKAAAENASKSNAKDASASKGNDSDFEDDDEFDDSDMKIIGEQKAEPIRPTAKPEMKSPKREAETTDKRTGKPAAGIAKSSVKPAVAANINDFDDDDDDDDEQVIHNYFAEDGESKLSESKPAAPKPAAPKPAASKSEDDDEDYL